MAESPPPMTAISLPEKKKPSQVAQELTPWPMRACSLGRFSQRALAPEAMMMVANSASLFSDLYLLGYSRDKELEADNLGLQYMMRAGYDPQAAVTVWQKMTQAQKGASPPQFLSTHPSHENRIADLQALQGVARPLYEAAAKP